MQLLSIIPALTIKVHFKRFPARIVFAIWVNLVKFKKMSEQPKISNF